MCLIKTHWDKAQQSEVPHFRRTQAKSKPVVRHPHHRHTVHATQSGDDDDDDDDDNNDNKHVANRRDVNKGWPKEAHYEPIVSPARTLGIKNQPFPLRAVVKAAIKHVTGDIIFDSAYPSADLNNFNKYHRQVLVESARSLSYNHLAGRFKKDDELLKLIAGVVNARTSRIRTQFKEVTDSKIEGFYLSVGTSKDTTARLAYLINQMNYIYPLKQHNEDLDVNCPYGHPAVISSIKHYFFVGDRGSSLANKHSTCFTSSFKDGPLSLELELPIAMVSLAATAIHASLVKWDETGSQKSKGFRAEEYQDIYEGHEAFLQSLKAEWLKFFHKTMHALHEIVA
ncbi:hypothetical protein BDN71DRAFT_1525446 [Pleurotus eryngii]|uniref:DUF6532 domain-containing protein n=1 Tax=Pleurotus eryngii TaxID=5323 RepID=A0A9P6DAR3_PLEER|nr:hypothetical protein BDN71DRAFT_1525446 [Pleurotus eryngii]